MLHICAAGEHVGPIERSIQNIKERARCMTHAVPYKRYTKLMTRSMIQGVVHWLNCFPSKNGVSDTVSSSTLVEGVPIVDASQLLIAFGAYA